MRGIWASVRAFEEATPDLTSRPDAGHASSRIAVCAGPNESNLSASEPRAGGEGISVTGASKASGVATEPLRWLRDEALTATRTATDGQTQSCSQVLSHV